jgi:hypothetical protein
MKAAGWVAGGVGSALLPIPVFLKGSLYFSSLFMTGWEMSQCPNAACMSPGNRQRTLSRTWKHIALGAATAGISGGLGVLAYSTNNVVGQAIGSVVMGCGFLASMAVVYSDRPFMGEYTIIGNDLELGADPGADPGVEAS